MTTTNATATTTTSLAQKLWTTKTYRLLVIILVQLTGSMFLVPVLPSLLTDDFAAARVGNGTDVLHCGDYEPDAAPLACVEAHGDVVTWSTTSGFFQNAVFSILVAPSLGAWSDVHGRKPVIVLSQLLSVAPITVLILHTRGVMRLCWIYVVQAFTQSVSIIAPSLAYMADRIDREHRAAAFGLIIASFSVAILIGPPVGALLPLRMVPYATLLMLSIATAGTVFFLPEEVAGHRDGRRENRQENRRENLQEESNKLVGALKILRRSPLFIKLTTILVITAATGEALQDLLIQYLQLKLGFGAADTSKMFMVLGAGALLVQGVLLQVLLRALGEARLLFVGLVVGGLQQLLLVLATSKWQAIGAVALGSLGSVTFPTISGIKANNSSPQEQGAVQGALYGARALSSGLGPLVFGALFRLFLTSDFPGTPFVVGAALMVVAAGIAWSLDEEQDGRTSGAVDDGIETLGRMETDDWREGIEAETMSLLPHST